MNTRIAPEKAIDIMHPSKKKSATQGTYSSQVLERSNCGTEETMNRLLLITRNFPPLWGGMERLNWNMAKELAKTFNVRLVGPTGASTEAPPGVIAEEAPLKPIWRFLTTATLRATRIARSWRPQIVLAGSGLTAPLAWIAARCSGAKSAVYVHGLDLAVPHPLYRALWYPLLRRMDVVIANSHPTAKLARNIGIAPHKISIIHPGVDIPSPDPNASDRFREKHDIASDSPILLSVGRLTARKGLREFVSEVLPIITSEQPNVVLAVVGDAPTDSLYAEPQSPKCIISAARKAGVEDNVRLLGKQFGRDLSDAYFAADIHVFPIQNRSNDPEGFGMVAVESAAHGLPTVTFATGGVIDAVADDQSGKLVPPGDTKNFAKEALRILKTPIPNQGCRNFAQNFTWQRFGCRILEALSNHTQTLSLNLKPHEKNQVLKKN